jgi:hypothetical protein
MENFEKLHVSLDDQLNAICKDVQEGPQEEGGNDVVLRIEELKQVKMITAFHVSIVYIKIHLQPQESHFRTFDL